MEKKHLGTGFLAMEGVKRFLDEDVACVGRETGSRVYAEKPE